MPTAFELLHPGVQRAIWDMRWRELNPVQRDCILAFNESNAPLIITAPTAGGKTEAAFLPILSHIASGKADANRSIRALYVGPLKALINDQFARLERICEHTQIPVHRWHGDVNASEKKNSLQNPGGVLLITPESIEALFLRRGREIPRLFSSLDYVVIDELHAFLENVRGIHLQSLLSRIAHHAGCHPRLLGLSATLGDYAIARAFLSPNASEKTRLIESANQDREIRLGIRAHLAPEDKEDKKSGSIIARYRITPDQWRATLATLDDRATTLTDTTPCVRTPSKKNCEVFFEQIYGKTQTDPRYVTTEFEDIAADVCRNYRQGANLIFGNAKRVIELVADTCHQTAASENWTVDPFYVHHGSLSKDERESVEAHLKTASPSRPATAFCSSTLEMGIDIGSIRAVGQIDPPWSVSSMVQRLGRSGRRGGEPSILRLYTRDSTPTAALVTTPEDFLFPDLLRSIALVRLLLQKWLEPPDSNRMHLSTLVHQILSHLCQTGGMSAPSLHDALLVRGPFRNISRPQFIALLRSLSDHELIEQMADGTLILGLAGEDITRNREFYAAFQSTEEFNILHNDHHLGMLAADLVPPAGENLILGGRRWEVVEIIPDEKRVRVTRGTNPKLPYFRSGGGSIADRIVCEMRNALNDTSPLPAWLDANAQTLFSTARDLAIRWQIAAPATAGTLIAGNDLVWFPWRGTKIMQTLALLAQKDGLQTTLGKFTLHYKNTNIDAWRAHLARIAKTKITSDQLSPLMPVKRFEKFDDYVPDSLLDIAVARERLDIEKARQTAAGALSTAHPQALHS